VKRLVAILTLLALALAAPGILTHGPRSAPKIALTFDADMTPGMKQNLLSGRVKSYNNTRIYAILEQQQVKATFFLTGMWIELYPQQAKALAQNPLFELANHSYSHPGFEQPCYGLPSVPLEGQGLVQAKEAQIRKTQALLESLGIHNTYFRFPGGCASPSDVAMVERLGLRVVHWDAAGEDGGQRNPQIIVRNVLKQAQNGSIIVLHSHGGPKVPATAEALAQIIPALKARGFEFVKVSELLAPHQ